MFEEFCAGLVKDEYFALLGLVSEFDERFLVLKGWSVTFSMATLALAFQKNLRSLFLVAALSAVSFWIIEASLKVHQNRYYPRMQQIELACSEGRSPPAPWIHFGWDAAPKVLLGQMDTLDEIDDTGGKHVTTAKDRVALYGRAMLLPYVALPHLVTLLIACWALRRRRVESTA